MDHDRTTLRPPWWLVDLVVLALPLVLIISAAASIVALAVAPSLAVLPVVLAVASGWSIVSPRRRITVGVPVKPVLIAAVNLQFDSPDPEAGVADVLALDPDIVVVSEMRPLPDTLLTAAYPFRIVSPPTVYETSKPSVQGVFSRLPITELAPPAGVPGELVRVAVGGDAPFTLFALHLPRPALGTPPPSLTTFAGHRAVMRALIAAVDAETGPVVITGDLNLSDRMPAYRWLVNGRVDVMRSTRAVRTFHQSVFWRLLSLRIDHLVVSPGWGASDARAFHLGGSDHMGITARIGPVDGSEE